MKTEQKIYVAVGVLAVAAGGLYLTNKSNKEALAGHLCRCSAYAGIIKTVKDTASYMRGEATL